MYQFSDRKGKRERIKQLCPPFPPPFLPSFWEVLWQHSPFMELKREVSNLVFHLNMAGLTHTLISDLPSFPIKKTLDKEKDINPQREGKRRLHKTRDSTKIWGDEKQRQDATLSAEHRKMDPETRREGSA